MHHWLRVLALPFLLVLSAAQAAPGPAIAYELAPQMQGDTIVALDVTIRLPASASGVTTIDWINEWAGETRLGQWASDIRVEGARSVSVAPNGGRIIHSEPGAPLVMRYRIVSGYEGDPDADDAEQALPVVRPGWFYALGEVLYARPVGRDYAPASFAWTGPTGIGFASDTEHATGVNGKPRAVSDILESVAIGGRSLSVSTVTLNGAPVRVARIGSFQQFSGPAFDRLAARIVSIERDFWHDTKAGPYLITAIPLAPSETQVTYNGIGRGDAFATWIDTSADLPSIGWLLAHEYFHGWNARQLGRFPAGQVTEAYWMSEGFTDFYARRLMLRGGLWMPQKFVDDWNEMLRTYAASRFRTARNADAAAQFWSGDYDAGQIAYQRGAMLAAIWDQRLRARGSSLDAVLFAQRDRVRAMRDMPVFTDAFIAEMARAGVDIRPDIDRYLTRGEPLTLPGDLFGDCARLIRVDVPVFELGWDADATDRAGGILTGINPASNAYAAGLRNGMAIVDQRSGEEGDPSTRYTIEVEDKDGRSRFYSFLPAGKRVAHSQQQIELDPTRFAAEPERCKAALGG